MAVACKKAAFAGDVELAEAEAMNFSIKVTVQSGLTPLVIEADAKLLILQKVSSIQGIYLLIQKFRTELRIAENLELMMFQYLENAATDIAWLSFKFNEVVLWLEDILAEVCNLLQQALEYNIENKIIQNIS